MAQKFRNKLINDFLLEHFQVADYSMPSLPTIFLCPQFQMQE